MEPGSSGGCGKYRGGGMLQDIPFPSLQVTGFEGCYGGDPQDLKEAALCGVVEKQAGNLLSLKRVRYIRGCP